MLRDVGSLIVMGICDRIWNKRESSDVNISKIRRMEIDDLRLRISCGMKRLGYRRQSENCSMDESSFSIKLRNSSMSSSNNDDARRNGHLRSPSGKGIFEFES
jgi:glutamyl/glutaminyl-tRNA synthetase